MLFAVLRHPALAAAYADHWGWMLDRGAHPYLLPVTSGWDRRPWGGSTDPRHDHSTPSRQEFADQVTQWGASDAPYPSADLSKIKGGTFLYVPTVTAPITVSYNVSGLKKPLNFTPATLAMMVERCGFAVDRCPRELPPLSEPPHRLRCWNPASWAVRRSHPAPRQAHEKPWNSAVGLGEDEERLRSRAVRDAASLDRVVRRILALVPALWIAVRQGRRFRAYDMHDGKPAAVWVWAILLGIGEFFASGRLTVLFIAWLGGS